LTHWDKWAVTGGSQQSLVNFALMKVQRISGTQGKCYWNMTVCVCTGCEMFVQVGVITD